MPKVVPPMSHKQLAALAVAASFVLTACTASEGQPEWTALVVAPRTPAPTVEASGSAAPATADPAAPVATPGTSAPATETVQLTIGTDTGAELRFDPTTATAATGSTIELTFENQSLVPHNLTFGEPINQGTAQIVDPGASETIEIPAPAAGSYQYVCTLHPGMEGTLTVE